ncbi:hypothetical protein FisN_5Lh457 [Fistulifera solaris]|uniref:Uncharacterized protein n=1 Tax=Fistulifera solaris TaxID=1519565 RepID=A0A1Z5KH03_FISSO|nr:hypothetical protein FisN_5Lh457 [Fistulifera solaris]|eukprot:GAX25362.1 hypothetical protein FisN_5Lh457 [Fistulifera solaris]
MREEPAAPAMNAGQRALEKIRRERAEQKNAELQRAREVLQQDKQVQQAAAAIPEKVAQRMGKRMIPFVGIPLFLSMGVFVGFWYMATYRYMSFEPSLVAASTILILVLGLLGITYSVMSTSWDPDREGSLLGTDEFSRNVDNIKEGLTRSRDNAVLRDKLASDREMQLALSKMDQEESKKKKNISLESKLNDELE